MRILVTGGAGYIGSVTVGHLLDCGHDVVVIDSLIRGNRAAVDPRAHLIVADVADSGAVRGALADREAVLHLAGLIDVAESMRESERYFEVNLRKATVLLDEMRHADIDALVFSSTAAVYGEPDRTPLDEDAPTRPLSPYGESKLAFETELASRVSTGLRSIVFRYFNVGGADIVHRRGEAHHPETHIIPRILGSIREGVSAFEVFGSDYPTPDGTCVRDYLHVSDLAAAHRIALETLGAGGRGGTYNLAGGRGYSNLEVVRACATVTGAQPEIVFAPRRPGDPATLVADASRAYRELGWRPSRDLDTIVSDAWKWHSDPAY